MFFIDEATSTAAMRVLIREYGLLKLYTALGSPPADVAAERERIKAVRGKLARMPSGAEKRAYLKWLDHAEWGADQSEKAWAAARRVDNTFDQIARP